MSRDRFITITFFLVIAVINLVLFSFVIDVTPLMVSLVIIACAVDFGIVIAYQRRIEDQAEWDTAKGTLVRWSGLLLYMPITTILIVFGFPSEPFSIGILSLLFALQACFLLGRELTINPKHSSKDL